MADCRLPPWRRSHLYPTVETRWFYEGASPPEAHSWFDATCGVVHPERRTDRYLILPDTDALGAKLRSTDRLELKLRNASLPIMSHDHAVGQPEQWMKWSLKLADPRVEELLDHPWLAVHKTRWLRRFGVSSIGRRTLHPDPSPARGGCGVELASLLVDGVAWWSLAFESYGAAEQLSRNFDVVTGAILGRRPFPRPLEEGRSFGYPRWLRDLAPEPAALAVRTCSLDGIAALVRSRLVPS